MENNKLICPFCGNKVSETIWEWGESEIWCSHCDITGDGKLWQELIKTKEQLQDQKTINDAIVEEGQNIIKDYVKKFEITKKQLDIAVDALKDIRCVYTGDQTTKPSTMFGRAAGALNKIQEIEQKDK